jgi:Fe-S-cluster-containing dehydrogenase component
VLKNLSAQGAKEAFGQLNSGESNLAYSDKALPFKRELLNKTLVFFPQEIKEKIVNNYFYDVKVSDDCNLCKACVKICPTGALRSNRNGAGKMQFSSASCIGCRLCEDFCNKGSIKIVRGYLGGGPDNQTIRKCVGGVSTKKSNKGSKKLFKSSLFKEISEF